MADEPTLEQVRETIREAIPKYDTGLPADHDMAKAMLVGLLEPEEQGPVWPRYVHHPENRQPSRIANNEEEESAILKEWGALPPPAGAPAASQPGGAQAANYETLVKEAEGLDIKVDRRWSEERLVAEIERAKREKR